MTESACAVQLCARWRSWYGSSHARELLILAIHLLVTFARLLRSGGVRAVAAESLLLKHQLLISNRSRQRAPNLTPLDRSVLDLGTLFVSPRRIAKVGALVKPATLFKFHKSLVHRKHRLLFSASAHRGKPGPKGLSAELIAAIVELKCQNPKFGCVRIAQQISHAFGVDIDKDVVRRVLAKHYHPSHSGSSGPSWLTLIGHAKDSLWSADLFRVESILLRSHWVMRVMDIFTRRIIGFGVDRAHIDGITVCRMFNDAIAGQPRPKHVCTDHDPLFRFHRWLATLRVLEIEEVKSVPYAPVSHPFVERLIGTIRRELLDQTFFWNALDLARKLDEFRHYYNAHRVHRSLEGTTPAQHTGAPSPAPATLDQYAWLAAALPRAVSDAHCGLITNSPRTRARSA
jgi:transposase InsO family protein